MMERRNMLAFLTAIPALAAFSDEIAAAMHGRPLEYSDTAGEVGTKMTFENEKVKVWEFILAPGELIPMHTHHMDYLFHVYEGSTLEVTYPPEAQLKPNKVDLQAGQVRYIEKGGRHAARNVGDKRYVEILVELKS
ncbi:MAG: cupin domain-containing protein [Pyrinomonadaceae bacterium]